MGGEHFQNVGFNLATIVVFGPYFGNATTLGLYPTHMELPIYGHICKNKKKTNDGNFFL